MIQSAHDGSGFRRMLIGESDPTGAVRELTHGVLPEGECFDWHAHDGLNEIMIVISGSGEAAERPDAAAGTGDGSVNADRYDYEPGDVVLFGSGRSHRVAAVSGDLVAVFVRYAAGHHVTMDRELLGDAIREYGTLSSSETAAILDSADIDAAERLHERAEDVLARVLR